MPHSVPNHERVGSRSEKGRKRLIARNRLQGSRNNPAKRTAVTSSPMTTPSPSTSTQPSAEPQPKRRRVSYACGVCRTKKNRCDGERPACGPCSERGLQCVYSPHRPRASVSQDYVDDLKARNERLERQLAAISSQNIFSSSPATVSDGHDGAPDQMAMGRQHFASPAHTSATAYPQQSGMLDMEMPAGDEVQIATAPESSRVTGQPLTPDDSGLRPADGTSLSTEFFGESSTFDFMNKVWSPDSAESPRGPSSLSNVRVLPGAVIAGKTSCSLATSSPSAPIFDDLPLGLGTDDAFGLPHRFVADRLVDAYFKFRHPLNAYLHENSFRSRYQRLWLSEDLGGEEATQNNLAWLGLVNLVFAFGSEYARVASRSAAAADRLRFFKRAKTLVFSGLLQAGSIELIQALLLMGQYLHGSLELNNCWTVVGLAIRTAQGLGLHRGEFTADIVEHEVRKRVWWGCFIIDRVLSMKVGRPPTIHDGPAIKVGLPLAVDDEYIVNDDARGGPPVQPPGIPSKLDFINQVIPLCRLLERILDTLYSGGGGCTPCQADASKPKLTDIPNLLAISIQLEGDLDTWQQALPAHLRFDSQVQGWHFERQRNTLLMRFLSCRLLVHRQVLLIYITRRITDSFQREIMHCCVRRCIMAAHDTVRQMQQLHQRHLLHSWWHNSHHVFAALGVLLAFQTLDTQSKAEVGLVSVDVDQVILRGTHLLEEVGDQMHPLASRYVQSFHQLQNRLRAISTARAYGGSKSSSSAVPHDTSSLNGIYSDPNSNPALTDSIGLPFPTPADSSMLLDGDDFSNIEDLLYTTDWTSLMADWSES